MLHVKLRQWIRTSSQIAVHMLFVCQSEPVAKMTLVLVAQDSVNIQFIHDLLRHLNAHFSYSGAQQQQQQQQQQQLYRVIVVHMKAPSAKSVSRLTAWNEGGLDAQKEEEEKEEEEVVGGKQGGQQQHQMKDADVIIAGTPNAHAQTCYVELHPAESLTFDLMTHDLVCVHPPRMLEKEEEERFFAAHPGLAGSASQLPRLLTSDPCVRHMGWQLAHGRVVRTERQSASTFGTTVEWRVIHEPDEVLLHTRQQRWGKRE